MSTSSKRQERVWVRKQVRLFDGLSEDDAAEIAQVATPIDLPKDSLLFAPYDSVEKLYLLKKGRIKLYKAADDGKEVTIDFLQPGDVLGNLSLVGDTPLGVFAEAVEDVRVWAVPRAQLQQLVQRKPHIAMLLIQAMSERVEHLEAQVEDLVFLPVPARVASALLRLAAEHGRVSPRGTLIDLRLTHQDIANVVGATRETVTNILNALREAGLIEIEHKRVLIPDCERLAQQVATSQK